MGLRASAKSSGQRGSQGKTVRCAGQPVPLGLWERREQATTLDAAPSSVTA